MSDEIEYEYTHSGELEFPNGERVTIPDPIGWEKVWRRDFDWPHRYVNGTKDVDRHEVRHIEGALIAMEYRTRSLDENARYVSIAKWKRVR